MEKLKGLKNHIAMAKYLFGVVMMLLIYLNGHRERYLIAQAAELLLIFFVTNLLLKKSCLAGYLANTLLLILYNGQMVVCLFASKYLYLLMLENTDSVEALSGRSILYITVLVTGILFALLPVRRYELKWREEWFLLPLLSVELMVALMYGNDYSPLFAYVRLAMDRMEQDRAEKWAEEMDVDFNFYHSAVDGRREPDEWVEKVGKPNVILIFTEGLSQNVIRDPREFMPNLAFYEDISMNFEGMFNHTAATYRGLMGQLYSSEQRDNLDPNHLPSLQSILRDEGYHTVFINSEPDNQEFSEYLSGMGFHEVYGAGVKERLGNSDSLSDKQAYGELFSMAEKLHKKRAPFFISMYTFGTHISFPSVDQVYPGEEENDLMNRFYDADYQFGDFMINFLNSDLKEDTVIIFTSDHATNEDYYFDEVFPPEEYGRFHGFCDSVPCFIFYDGMTPEVVECGGRTSIDLAPTILDFLNLSGPNYFLGTTMFAPQDEADPIEMTYYDGEIYSTRHGVFEPYGKNKEMELLLYINTYCNFQQEMSR